MKKKKIIPIMLVAVAVVAAFCVYYFVLRKAPEETPQEAQQEQLEKTYYYVPGDYFVTNINGSDALGKTSVALALTGKDQTEFLDKHNAVIRNAIIKVLISHSEEDMRTTEAIDTLQGEMTTALKAALALEDLEGVYISDFVIQ